MTHTWTRESHKVTKELVIDSVLFMYIVTIVSVMTQRMIVFPTLVVISNRVRHRRMCYMVQRTKINVTSDLIQKIEMKDNRCDQQKYRDQRYSKEFCSMKCYMLECNNITLEHEGRLEMRVWFIVCFLRYAIESHWNMTIRIIVIIKVKILSWVQFINQEGAEVCNEN